MATAVFRILIDLPDDREVFRDIELDEGSTFETLYNAIIDAFGFSGDQMASFYVCSPDWDRGEEISLMDMGGGMDMPIASMTNTQIKDRASEFQRNFLLVYDFLKMWTFLIEYQGPGKGVDSPTVILSMGAAPSEDEKEVDDIAPDEPSVLPGLEDWEDELQDDDEPDEFENIDDLDI